MYFVSIVIKIWRVGDLVGLLYLVTGVLQIKKMCSAKGILALELSSYVLDIPNDFYTTMSQNLIGCSTLSQEY